MRFHLSILLLVLSQPVFADAYKCRPSTGQAVITERPCDNGYGYASSAKSDGTDTESYRRAQADLQRQKDWLRQREADQRGSSSVQSVYVAAPSYDRDAIYACLMKVTATLNLRPVEQAHRKVNCYPGGVGLVEDCKSSVHATMLLSSSEEAAIKSTCR